MKEDSNNTDIQIIEPSSPNRPDEDYPSSKDSTLKATGGGNMGNGDNNQFSSVAVGASSKKFLIIGIVGVFLGVSYFIFKSFKEQSVVEKTPTQKIQERSEAEAQKLIKEAKPVNSADQVDVTQAPKLPEPLPIQAPQPPDPPPPPVPVTPQAPIFPQPNSKENVPIMQPFSQGTTSFITDSFSAKDDSDARLKALEERRKSSIMVMGGSSDNALTGAGGKGSKDDKDKDKDKEAAKADKSAFLGFGEGTLNEGALARTKAPQVKATHIGNLDHIITQGKLIHAVLETAINTDLPGPLRAIVARDVYGESGKTVLIPKGSRVVGNYEASVKPGQTRIAVVWNRLIRPDGVDIALDSPGTDTLGRSGIPGFLDDKFLTKLGNALLISYVVPKLAETVFNANSANSTPITSTATTNPQTGATTTSTTATFKQQQLKDSQDKFTQVMDKAIQESFSTTPTLFVDQGTEVNIFANKDLVFPGNAAIGTVPILK